MRLRTRDTFPSSIFGVEVHANIAGNLLDRSWLKKLAAVDSMMWLCLASLWTAFFGIYLSPEKSALFLSALLGGILFTSYTAFSVYHHWLVGIGTSPMILAIILSSITGAIYHYVIIKRFKDYIEAAFQVETEERISPI